MSGTYYFLVPLFAAIGNLALAIVVLRRDRRNELNRAFAFTTVAMVFWNLNIFVFSAFTDAHAAFFWSRFFRVGTLLMPVAATHFFFVFSETRPQWVRRLLPAGYAAATLLIAANAADLLVSDLRRYPLGFYYVGTPLYRTFTLLAFVCAAVTFYLLVSEYLRSPSPRKRFQSRLWLLGTSVAIPFGLTNLIIEPGSHIPPLGNLANTVYVAIVAYGIVRHRLMDIDIVVTKGMAYAAVSFVLIAPAFALTLWLQQLSFGRIHPDFSFTILLMLVAVGVLFPTLRLRAESRIEQSFFREKHQYRVALVAFTRSIVRILDRDRLIRELTMTLSQTLQLDRIAIALIDEPRHAFTIRYTVGIPPASEEFPTEHPFIASLTRRQEAALRDELEASPDLAQRVAAAEICQRNGWEVCIPLTVGSTLIGFIALGRKRNLDVFFAEDMELLGTLGAEASVALENARLYEELKRSQDIIRRADRLSALGTLAAGIAHEVRNPLVSIQTFFQLAPDRLHDEEFFSTFLGMTANEVKRISNLISELLSFARSPTRTLGPLNLSETVERVVTLLEPEAKKHTLTMTHGLPAELPLVQADGDQIKQVLINLILNAIQATSPGGEVSVTGQAVHDHHPPFVRLEVRDTGVGIPKERLNDIFNPFFTTKDKGTGLGLAIAHQIVVEHGGSLTVESTEGHGTSFFIDLPAVVENAADLHADQPAGVVSLPLRYERPRKVAS